MNDKKLSIEIYRKALEIMRIANRAVRKAQERNRKLNIPNVYDYNGTLYYELPNGKLSLSDPYIEISK